MAIAALFFVSGPLSAQLVLISSNSTTNDGGFDAGSGTFMAYSGGNGYPDYENIGSAGVTNQTTANGTLEWTVTSNYDSNNLGFANDGGFSQTGSILFFANGGRNGTITSESNLNYTVSAGDVINLSVYINSNDSTDVSTAGVTPTLNIGGSSYQLASKTNTSPGQWDQETWTYTVTGGEAGQSLNNVALNLFQNSGYTQNYLDSVQLSVTQIPEPGIGVLMALAMTITGAVWFRRLSEEVS